MEGPPGGFGGEGIPCDARSGRHVAGGGEGFVTCGHREILYHKQHIVTLGTLAA